MKQRGQPVADKMSPSQRSENMRRIKGKGTKPELLVRSSVHALGYRFRLHRRELPGNPDLVFIRHRKIILVHGCFWHSHGDPNCVDGRRRPKSNLDYWLPKLARNKIRDQENQTKLADGGWSVLVIWECETRNYAALTQRLRQFLG